jgi:redox-sensitive bicupin YhaK (pirin superfamily)
MTVRRTLPQRERSLIGAWCFVDHYGPEVKRMDVPPHPHTGLQTVSWLFAGDIEHRDSVGSHAFVRPGELNLMTAGAGIAHSEISVALENLHGAQLWVALPEAARHRAPSFERFISTPVQVGPAVVRVFIGALAGMRSTATIFTPLLGAQIDVPAGATVRLDVDPAFEHGVLVDAGELRVEDATVPPSHLAYLAPGRETIELAADTDARLLLLGGEPFPDHIVMWWNFIGRDHDEIVAFRDQWQADVIHGGNPHGRFGTVDGGLTPLPAPELPNVRLKPREQPR